MMMHTNASSGEIAGVCVIEGRGESFLRPSVVRQSQCSTSARRIHNI